VMSPADCGGCAVACTSPPICATAGPTPACVQAIAVADGTMDSFALLSNGSVDGWGSDNGGFQSYTNNDGQLGDNAPVGTETLTPSPVSTTAAATAIASGDSHSCALLANGTVECWGDNTVGELGVDTTDTFASSVPVVVPGLANVIAIDVGGTISCALITGGTVECWGYNGDDELGSTSTASCNGVDPCSSTPVAIPGLSGVQAIAVGNASAVLADHACALLSSGTVKCWGYNGNGEVGNGTISTSGGIATPVTVSGITTATAIQAHQYGACALLTGGSVKCWGSGTNGELGNGSTNASPTPVSVSNLTDAQSLSVGSSAETVCAVRTNGNAVCWGFNGNAQLGNGAPSSTLLSSTPVPVSLLTNVAQIAGSTYHMCAVLTTGEVWCWGDNGDDELANSSAAGNYNPTPVAVQW
jgi:alpha-tubulin suppressor-like RCC1 family protein